MNENEKVALCQSMIPDVSVTEDQIQTYLVLALQRIADRLYPFSDGTLAVPSRYDQLQCELAVRMIARRGGEGELSHTENGIARRYGTVDDMDLLSRIVPFVGVL